MPHKLQKDEFGGPNLVWWAEDPISEDEINRFPWLNHPEYCVAQSEDVVADDNAAIENPTYSGEMCLQCQRLNFDWLLQACPSQIDIEDVYVPPGQRVTIQYTTLAKARLAQARGCPTCALFLHALTVNPNIHYEVDALVEEEPEVTQEQSSGVSVDTSCKRQYPVWCTLKPSSFAGHFCLYLSVRTHDRILSANRDKKGSLLSYIIDPAFKPDIQHEHPGYIASGGYHSKHFRPIPGGDGSQVDLNAVRSLIDRCISNCRKHRIQSVHSWTSATDPPFQETYILDVQQGCIRYENIYVCEYLTLSYVWGSAETFRVTTKMLKELQRPGSVWTYTEKLPLTIKDAITACQLLGYRYLWIDQLCVAPDSPAIESILLNMHLIYGLSHATLVATAGQDANAGLPGVREGSRELHQATAVSTSGIQLAVGVPLMKFFGSRQPPDSVWDTRAWTFQENLCSQRLIFFMPEQLHFHGPCISAGEQEILNQTYRIHSYPRNPIVSNIEGHFRITTHYTGRELTHDYDIYHAYAGVLARMAQNYPNPTFLAAMPAAYLDLALLFTIDGPSVRRLFLDRNKETRLPSWSWLGWKGQVSWNIIGDAKHQVPCIQWIPDRHLLQDVEDLLVVLPRPSIWEGTGDEVLVEARDLETQHRPRKARFGCRTPKFHNVMLTELHIRADVALFGVGKCDSKVEGRFQLHDRDGIVCGIIHLNVAKPEALCRCLKVALGTIKWYEPAANRHKLLPSYDGYRYKKGKVERVSDKHGKFVASYDSLRILMIDGHNERMGDGYVHVDAFDEMVGKAVDIVLR